MARLSDPAKVAQWRRRLERFELSNVSVARFCGREGVSVASFYQWRQKLAARTDRPAAPRRIAPAASAFKPLSITGAASPAVTATRHPAKPFAGCPLPGGARLEVPAGDRRTVRVVVRELVRSGQSPSEGGGSC